MTPNIKTDMTGLTQIYPRDIAAASVWVDKCTYVRFTHSTMSALDDLKFRLLTLLIPEFQFQYN